MKEPNCFDCHGACCELFSVQVEHLELADNERWFALRTGAVKVKGHGLMFLRECAALRADGYCAIYDSRPEACRAQVVGGPDCLAAIELRRPAYHAELLK